MEQINTEYHRPWGYYIILADEDDHKVKRIVVKPQKRLSLQLHHKRSEHWYVTSGQAEVTLGEQIVPLKTGEAVDIPAETAHRVQNPGSVDLAFIEIQTGTYFGEDDIVRLEDDFGRV
ncbi:MAG: phosphomannose isomerase type II C-terminal cupin domain [Deltaproteobacteria bacterium]|nr:phosphomannose isomerase type II C-terminal cupin domain [Deltaproteobacteria bacterium]